MHTICSSIFSFAVFLLYKIDSYVKPSLKSKTGKYMSESRSRELAYEIRVLAFLHRQEEVTV